MRTDGHIRLSEQAQWTMHSAAKESIPFETGGILLGHYENDTAVVVSDALVVPGHATATSYTRDDVKANRLLAEFLESKDKGDPTGYVGEWHVHPSPVGPSPTDIKAISGAARNSQVSPLALVIPAVGSLGIKFWGMLAHRRRYRRTSVRPAKVILISNKIG